MTISGMLLHSRRIHRLRLNDLVATLFSLSVIAFVLSCPQAVSAQNHLMTRHVREVVANGQAVLVGHFSPTQPMSLAIMLPLRNQAALDALLKDLYDPQSPYYHQFLSVDQFTQRFGPTSDDYQSVVNFVRSGGFSVGSWAANRMLVEVEGSVEQIEKTFHVSINIYRYPGESRVFFAPDREPTVDVNVPLWHVSGLDDYSVPQPAMVHSPNGGLLPTTTNSGSGPYGLFLPGDMRAAYYGGTALTGSGQCVGLGEFGGYNISDVALTFDGAATSATDGTNYTLYYTTGGVKYTIPVNNVALAGYTVGDSGDAGEQALDIAQAIGMAPGLSQVRVYTAPNSFTTSGSYTFPTSGSDSVIFNTMASEDLCKQLSLSWHWEPESLTENDPTFQEFGAQGQSFFSASGDWGSFPTPEADYYYPPEDIYVIAVGGTDLTTNGAGGAWESEIAWGGANVAAGCPETNYYGSSGGPSPDHVAIPSYQQLSGVINSSNKGSTVYRNVPDVAMEANCDNYYCDQGACSSSAAGGVGGTSYATPRWAGFMALVNQQNLTEEGTVEGFINPTIYSIGVGPNYSSYFHDITVGDNFNSENPSLYSAVTGYDLVTGWGSPVSGGWVAAPVETNWPMVGFTAAGNRYNPYESVIGPSNVASLTTLWSFGQRAETIAPPVVENGVLYTSVETGTFYAFNAKTGATEWTFKPDTSTFSSAAVANGVVYVAMSGTLYALNAGTGAEEWTSANGVTGSPVVSGGIVYVYSDTTSLLSALNATTGAQLWTFSLGGSSLGVPPSVASGVLYISNSSGTTLYALNATTGKTLWTFAPSGGVGSATAVAGQSVYVSDNGRVYALNANTGAELWSSSLCDSSVIVADNIVYCGGEKLYALNASTGAELWTFTTDNNTAALSAVANGVVYITNEDDVLYAVNANTGTQLASYSEPDLDVSSPIVVNGVIYFTYWAGEGDNWQYLAAWAP
jgi:outer membrane protein assembly factor BamB